MRFCSAVACALPTLSSTAKSRGVAHALVADNAMSATKFGHSSASQRQVPIAQAAAIVAPVAGKTRAEGWAHRLAPVSPASAGVLTPVAVASFGALERGV